MEHAGDAAGLYRWLKGYDIDYLVVNLPYAYLHSGEAAANAVPITMTGWETYFQTINEEYYIYVYSLR